MSLGGLGSSMADIAAPGAGAAAGVRGHNYKALKEAFVSNLNGGTIAEVNLVTLIAPAAILLWSILQSRYSYFTPYTGQAAFTEFLLNCGAILCGITIYANNPLLLLAGLAAPAFFTFISTPEPKNPDTIAQPPKINKSDEAKKPNPLPIKPFVTMYRGGMMIITCAAILAVDFHLFPRRFAKVETWGTSLMDMGVGSFVFAAGVTSARGILKDQLSGKKYSITRRLRDATRHSLPLLILGVIRLISVKGVDYAEHVTEYGVHWNFFFTLGFLPPFMAVFNGLFTILPSYEIMAIVLGVCYEVALDYGNLTALVVAAPRDGLFLQNREGILSFFGYLAIFLSGQGAGMYVLTRETTPSSSSDAKKQPQADPFSGLINNTTRKLIIWTIVWTGLFIASTEYFGLNLRVSRRLANLPYVLWVSAFNTGQLLLLALIEKICFPYLYTAKDSETERSRCREATSTVMHAFNRNGLAIFLVANLLTGAINLALPTLFMRRIETLAVLLGYMGILAGLALILDKYNISIKL